MGEPGFPYHQLIRGPNRCMPGFMVHQLPNTTLQGINNEPKELLKRLVKTTREDGGIFHLGIKLFSHLMDYTKKEFLFEPFCDNSSASSKIPLEQSILFSWNRLKLVTSMGMHPFPLSLILFTPISFLPILIALFYTY